MSERRADEPARLSVNMRALFPRALVVRCVAVCLTGCSGDISMFPNLDQNTRTLSLPMPPCSGGRSACSSLSPTKAYSLGDVNTVVGTYWYCISALLPPNRRRARCRPASMATGVSSGRSTAYCATSDRSCAGWCCGIPIATSPMAYTLSAVVRSAASTSTLPFTTATPALSRCRSATLACLPTASSTVSNCSVRTLVSPVLCE